jgi:hypothetical protein
MRSDVAGQELNHQGLMPCSSISVTPVWRIVWWLTFCKPSAAIGDGVRERRDEICL